MLSGTGGSDGICRNGFNQMSQRLHHFIREHIVRGTWQKKERPILLNSWEASYFDISEKKLLKLAKEAKEVGIELFVMDDGWFGERMDDSSSLGDWEANAKKLPGGLKGLSDKIHGLGLQFGIWVEPEMVNVKANFMWHIRTGPLRFRDSLIRKEETSGF